MKAHVPLVFLVSLPVIVGCGDKDTDSAAPLAHPPVDTAGDTAATGTAGDTADPCADVPMLTYNNFGKGFMTENCQGCHASTSAERYGAPESVTFDTVDEVWTWSERILSRSAGADASMPPAGGVSKDDRTKLEWWLLCAEEGT